MTKHEIASVLDGLVRKLGEGEVRDVQHALAALASQLRGGLACPVCKTSGFRFPGEVLDHVRVHHPDEWLESVVAA